MQTREHLVVVSLVGEDIHRSLDSPADVVTVIHCDRQLVKVLRLAQFDIDKGIILIDVQPFLITQRLQ